MSVSLEGVAKKLDIVTLMYQNKRLAKTTVLLMEMMETLHEDLNEGHTNPPHPHTSSLNEFDRFRLQ